MERPYEWKLINSSYSSIWKGRQEISDKKSMENQHQFKPPASTWQSAIFDYCSPRPTSVYPNQAHVHSSLPSYSASYYAANLPASVSNLNSTMTTYYDPTTSHSYNAPVIYPHLYNSYTPIHQNDENEISTTYNDRLDIPVSGQSNNDLDAFLWGDSGYTSSRGRSTGVANKKKSSSKEKALPPYLYPRDKKCSNCGTEETTLWRRNKPDQVLCNACGLYWNLHRYDRPSHLWKNHSQRRHSKSKEKKAASLLPN